jgi:transposase InsO family protein
MIAPEAGLSVSRQCALLGIARSSLYYRPRPEGAEELELLKRLDRIFTDYPVYGSRRLQVALLREGISVGRRRVRRLMKKLGLWAVRPKRNTSKRHPEHKVYPYLLSRISGPAPQMGAASDEEFVPDSPLEGSGFEPSVPRKAPAVVLVSVLVRADFSVSGESSGSDMSPSRNLACVTRYRRFESGFLQR